MSEAAEILSLVDKHLPDPVRTKVGLAPSRVRALAAAGGVPIAEDARRLLAKEAQRCCRRCHRLPDYAARTMHADYLARGLPWACRYYGFTKQALHSIFKTHGLTARRVKRHATVEFAGDVWHADTFGYFAVRRGGKRTLLHYVVWQAANGPVPAGHRLVFLNGIRSDVRPANLRCVTRGEAMRLMRERCFGAKERAA